MKIISKFEAIVGSKNMTTDKEDLLCYAYDATNRHFLPDAVVFPGNTNEVSAIMALAHKHNIFVVPRGAGTGMSGGGLAVRGGMIMAMTRFNRILSIDKENLIAHVEPGVITGQFQEEVEKQGLFYPPDPSSAAYCTLGGNIAECAGGSRAVKYGVTRDYVLGLEVVLPSGQVITTGVQTAKGVVGYDLTRLIVGSEGTLGIVTKIILRLLPLPETVRTLSAVFQRIEDAASAVAAIMCSGIIPRTLEYMDQAAIQCVEDYLHIGLPVDAAAMLLVDVDGSSDTCNVAIEHLASICKNQQARQVTLARNEEDRTALWQARKAISPALFRLAPDKINEDIVVPRSKIPAMVKWVKELQKQSGLTMVTFGHAGDGNIHCNIMLDKRDREVLKKAEAAVEAIFKKTISLGGTISGEHGVGVSKAPYLTMEIGPEEMALMKRIKTSFDPKGILNPGKIFP